MQRKSAHISHSDRVHMKIVLFLLSFHEYIVTNLKYKISRENKLKKIRRKFSFSRDISADEKIS